MTWLSRTRAAPLFGDGARGSTAQFSSESDMAGSVAAAEPGNGEYRALVCVFLAGGNDSFNMLVPRSGPPRTAYANARGGLALPVNQLIALNAADGTQQDAVRVLALFELGGGQRVAEFINGLAAHISAGVGKGVAVLGGNLVQHAHCLRHDFGAGAVTVNQGNILVHLCSLLVF